MLFWGVGGLIPCCFSLRFHFLDRLISVDVMLEEDEYTRR